ncbi:C3a anaphylatoxin chemotactic receptor-like isoform X1 [Megalobrama amblycephala]|uniref:C3a anaphylatoxin chemotactic receptor-like isoform X1 n=1 Tax=Megalobrama amblycephala TaxID=75352 RepID=UPI0020141964|nr:C3a anaphylatoxin chemotactic receptor-like isoform X1 [Megalobrama amblycephala]
MENTSFGHENFTGGTTNNTTIQPMNCFTIFLICISIPTFIVGFIGNGLVIFLTGCRMKTTVNSIWFLNLAIADFIFILSMMISMMILPFIVNFSSLGYVISMMVTLNLFASIFFLVVISLDRCLCTTMVVWAQNNRTVLRARIICVIVWVLSISCSIPSFVNEFPTTFLVTYEFLVGFLIPFLIIASSHIAVGVRIKRLKTEKQHRSYRVIIAIILTFFVCWFPYHVCIFIVIKMDNWGASDEEVFLTAFDLFEHLSIYLVFLNSCLNPILYVFMCDEYKKKLKKSLLLVLETAFSEEHLIFRGRQIQKDEQNTKSTFESLDM